MGVLISRMALAKKNALDIQKTPAERRPGDWNCPQCNDLQFERNAACRSCGTPNPNPRPAPDTEAIGYKTKMCQFFEKGDCVRAELCKFAHGQEELEWALQQQDAIVAAMGPADLSLAPMHVQAFLNSGMVKAHAIQQFTELTSEQQDAVMARGNLSDARDATAVLISRMALAKKGELNVQKGLAERREGDWNCPTCGDVQFASRSVCRHCQTPAPGGDTRWSSGFSGNSGKGGSTWGAKGGCIGGKGGGANPVMNVMEGMQSVLQGIQQMEGMCGGKGGKGAKGGKGGKGGGCEGQLAQFMQGVSTMFGNKGAMW